MTELNERGRAPISANRDARGTSLVLVDDHRIFREGLRALLEAEPGFRVIGDAGDGLTGIELVAELKPFFVGSG